MHTIGMRKDADADNASVEAVALFKAVALFENALLFGIPSSGVTLGQGPAGCCVGPLCSMTIPTNSTALSPS